jgi:hypothetical protein
MKITRSELAPLIDKYLRAERKARMGVAFQQTRDGIFLDQMVYGEVVHRYKSFLDGEPSPEDDFLDTLPPYTAHGGTPLELAQEFLKRYFEQIRKLICDDKKRKTLEKGSGVTRSSIPIAVSTWIMSHFGVTEPVALGLAAYISIVVFEASRGAFCEMTKEQIDETISRKRKKRVG